MIPYCYLSYCDNNPAEGRWDQAWVDRMLRGRHGRPPGGFTFERQSWESVRGTGGVVVFPAGHYAEHCDEARARMKLMRDLRKMPWAVVIATSDECATFAWGRVDPWPDHVRLWVMLPRPEHRYPDGATFIGEGSPRLPQDDGMTGFALTRDLDVFISAQGGHIRRNECFDALARLPQQRVRIERTGGFTQGMEPDEYMHTMTRTWVAPAPSGPCTPSSFRVYEALESGAIPLADGLRPWGNGGFWEMLGMGEFLPVIDDWAMAPAMIADLLEDRAWSAAKVSAGWQQYQRDVLRRLHHDVQALSGATGEVTPDDRITVIVPTSPTPTDPNPSRIIEVIRSVQEQLPHAEILITCDGVRPEQAHRRDAYVSYLKFLFDWTLTQPQITPFLAYEHLHQSGMMRAVLSRVHTDHVLYVEHDCPLVGEPIPWQAILDTMEADTLNSMRFMHEAFVLPGHEHLFFDRVDSGPAWYMPTLQWSQRPHLARTDWYREIVSTYFGANARTFVEDVMHGVVQHGFALNSPYATRKHAQKAWERFRLAVYAPHGDLKRSGNLDGRGDDPKYPLFIAYDGERPEGAPPEGEWI